GEMFPPLERPGRRNRASPGRASKNANLGEVTRTQSAKSGRWQRSTQTSSLLSDAGQRGPAERTMSMTTGFFDQQQFGQTGSRDGQGAGDHDQPYRFGWRPRSSVPFPFNTRQYARLLLLRGRVQDSLAGQDDLTRATHAP